MTCLNRLEPRFGTQVGTQVRTQVESRLDQVGNRRFKRDLKRVTDLEHR